MSPADTDNPIQVTTTPLNTTTINSHTAWMFTPTSNTHEYQSITRSTIQADNSNVPQNQDTTSLLAQFTATTNQSATGITITGSINELSISPGFQAGLTSLIFSSPINFSGTITNENLVLENIPSATHRNDTTCENPDNMILGEVRPIFMMIPFQLLITSTWADTTITKTCIGSKISSDLRIVRSYSIVGEIEYAKTPTLFIRRVETIYLKGTGTLDQHQITVEGYGSGFSNIYLDLVNATILTVESHQNARFTVNTPSSSRHFKQITDQNIKPRS